MGRAVGQRPRRCHGPSWWNRAVTWQIAIATTTTWRWAIIERNVKRSHRQRRHHRLWHQGARHGIDCRRPRCPRTAIQRHDGANWAVQAWATWRTFLQTFPDILKTPIKLQIKRKSMVSWLTSVERPVYGLGQSHIDKFEELQTAFKDRFGITTQQKHGLRTKIYACRQLLGEPFKSFVGRVQELPDK